MTTDECPSRLLTTRGTRLRAALRWRTCGAGHECRSVADLHGPPRRWRLTTAAWAGSRCRSRGAGAVHDHAEHPATMTVEQAGRLLGISRWSAYRAAARGERCKPGHNETYPDPSAGYRDRSVVLLEPSIPLVPPGTAGNALGGRGCQTRLRRERHLPRPRFQRSPETAQRQFLVSSCPSHRCGTTLPTPHQVALRAHTSPRAVPAARSSGSLTAWCELSPLRRVHGLLRNLQVLNSPQRERSDNCELAAPAEKQRGPGMTRTT